MTGQASALKSIEPALTPRPIDSGVRIGHVHLKVADLDRALRFYCGVLGLELTQRYGRDAAFISAGGYHHHIGLNTWESRGRFSASRPVPLVSISSRDPLSHPRRFGRCSSARPR